MLNDRLGRHYTLRISTLPNKDIWIYIFFIAYLFMSFFEGYINFLLGAVTKYFIVVLILAIVFKRTNRKNLPSYSVFLITWLLFKNLSLFWGGNSYFGMQVVNAHFLSQMFMVALFAVISTARFTDQFVNKVIDSAFFFGALLSVLAIFFSEPYHGVYTARLTLTIAGIQMDPNDLSAFFLFCSTVALYRIIIKKDPFFLNVSILIISTIASGMTASRGGLVSYIVVAIVMTFVSSRKRRSFLGSLKRIAVISIILTMLYFGLTYILPNESFERLFVNAYESGSGRLDIWRESVFAFTANPLVGYGWGGSYYRVHNTYLNILVDNGLVGMLFFLSFLFLLVLKAIRTENALAVCIIFAGITPAFFIEAITKRFFWNAFIIGVLLINRLESNSIEHKSVKTDNLQSNYSPLRNIASNRETAHSERRLQ